MVTLYPLFGHRLTITKRTKAVQEKKVSTQPPWRGIEPRSPAWQAGILTTILPKIWAFEKLGSSNVGHVLSLHLIVERLWNIKCKIWRRGKAAGSSYRLIILNTQGTLKKGLGNVVPGACPDVLHSFKNVWFYPLNVIRVGNGQWVQSQLKPLIWTDSS